jgi:hypothetical protein
VESETNDYEATDQDKPTPRAVVGQLPSSAAPTRIEKEPQMKTVAKLRFKLMCGSCFYCPDELASPRSCSPAV